MKRPGKCDRCKKEVDHLIGYGYEVFRDQLGGKMCEPCMRAKEREDWPITEEIEEHIMKLEALRDGVGALLDANDAKPVNGVVMYQNTIWEQIEVLRKLHKDSE